MDSNAWSSLHNPSCKSSYFNQLYHGGAASQNASNYSHYPYGNYGASSPYTPHQYETATASSSLPPQAAFVSCQQAVEQYSPYSHSSYAYGAGYGPYPFGTAISGPNMYQPMSGASLPQTNSSGSSSPTYQSQGQTATETNSHYHSNLDNQSPPLLKSTVEVGIVPNGGTHLTTPKPKATKSNKRGRRAPNPSPSPEQCLEQVFIWDLDETLIQFHLLLGGAYDQRFHKVFDREREQKMKWCGLQMEKLINEVGDRHFFFNDLEDCDQMHVDEVASDDTGQDLSYNFDTDGFLETTSRPTSMSIPSTGVRGGVDWMRKLAFRYRKIKDSYNHYRYNVGEVLGKQEPDWIQIKREIEYLTDEWLTTARKCLEIISRRPNCANIVVTQTQLVPAISKLLINDLGQFFPIENIYSAAKVGKDVVFDRIQQKYGKKTTFVAIGDGPDEESAAKRLTIPFWRISQHSDLRNLHHALIQEML